LIFLFFDKLKVLFYIQGFPSWPLLVQTRFKQLEQYGLEFIKSNGVVLYERLRFMRLSFMKVSTVSRLTHPEPGEILPAVPQMVARVCFETIK